MASVPSTFEMTQHSRLSIAHLLLWTCGVAAGVRCYLPLLSDLQDWVLPLGYLYTLVMGSAIGTFATGAVEIADQRYRRRQRYPRLPGHWLLLLGFAAVLAGGATITYDAIRLTALSNPQPWLSTDWSHVYDGGLKHGLALEHQTIGWGLGSIVALTFMASIRGGVSRCWGRVFALFFAASLILFGGYLVTLLRHMGLDTRDGWLWVWFLVWCRRSGEVLAWLFAICGAGMLCAVVDDVRRRAPSDWLHWTGIGAWLAVAAIQIATCIVIAFRT